MSISPRWSKLIGDFDAIRGRLLMVIIAMTIGMICSIAITSAFTVLNREIQSVYMHTNPASGILDIGAVDDALVARVNAMDGIAGAEPLSIIKTRTRNADGTMGRALLFVSPNPLEQTIGIVRPEQVRPTDSSPSILVERRSLAIVSQEIGGAITLEIPGTGFVDVTIQGTVFDPALAPAEQEQSVYAYMDFATYQRLGGTNMEMIKLIVADAPLDQNSVDSTLVSVANTLRAEGINVHMLQVPSAGKHPHQSQLQAILALFLAFGIVAFLLSALLVSVTIEGLMVQQIRQIGIMKAIGGQTRQITSVYFVGVGVIGLLTLIIAIPVGRTLGLTMSDAIGSLLNFDIANRSLPSALYLAWIIAGLMVPILFALRPILRATGMSVIEALADRGISKRFQDVSILERALGVILRGRSEMRVAITGVFRNKSRAAMVIFLIAAAGAVVLTARNTSSAYSASITIAADERPYDLDIRLTRPLADAALSDMRQVLATDVDFDAILTLEVARARADGLALVRTYPDGGHGSMTLFGLDDASSLANFKTLQGILPETWHGGVVVNQSALAMLGNPKLGEQVRLSLDGQLVELPLTAVLRQYMAPASVFVARTDIEALTDIYGVNTLRVEDAVSPAVFDKIEQQIIKRGGEIATATSENQMAAAVSGHVNMLILILSALGIMMACVGLIGLATAQGTSVAERRREFGILRAIGAQRRQILANVLTEGAIFWGVSLVAGFLVSLPLSIGLGALIGDMTFGMPLPFSFDLAALGWWSLTSLAGALFASLPPAFSAARLSVHTILSQQ